MHRYLLTAVLLIGTGLSSSVRADTMRCGNKLITFGDTRSLVRELCGEPTDILTRSILRRSSYMLNGRIVYFGDGYVEVPVEIWTFNFGPYKLMREVRFVDGHVDDIQTLGYGYHEKNP